MLTDESLHPITKNQLKYLIAMDDWSSIARLALPFIMDKGPQAISYLFDKYAPNSVKKFVGSIYETVPGLPKWTPNNTGPWDVSTD